MRQKKIALINDITGFGRCSVAVMAPIISAMKIQAVAVPTAILSTHTQFPEYYFDDYTPRMRDYIQTYKNLNMEFDGIATGFLESEEQVDIVIDFIQSFGTNDSMFLVDPVMGDYGKLYKTYTPQIDHLSPSHSQDNTDRIEVERRFSIAKRKFGLGLLLTKREDTTNDLVFLSSQNHLGGFHHLDHSLQFIRRTVGQQFVELADGNVFALDQTSADKLIKRYFQCVGDVDQGGQTHFRGGAFNM